MKLSVIIVNWNVWELLHKCLVAVEENLNDIPHETIVVDNASADGSPALIRERHPGVSLIRNSENRGFAAACNQAAEKATGEFLLFLNPDAVPAPGVVQELLLFLEQRPEAAAAPTLNLPNGILQLGPAGNTPSVRSAFNHFFMLYRICSKRFPGIWLRPRGASQPLRVDWLSGACLMLRRGHFESAGGFDERFFMYAEDMDLCARLSEKGISFHLLPALVRHDRGAAFRLAGSPDYCMDSLFYYFQKHHGESDARKALRYAWLGLHLRALALGIAGGVLRNGQMLKRSKILAAHSSRARRLSIGKPVRK